MKTVAHFCDTFSMKEARRLLHTMIRAALAQKDVLNKAEIRDLLFLKEELVNLIRAAAYLAKRKDTDLRLCRLFLKRDADEQIQALDFLLHDAIYDSVFTSSPPPDRDIYQTWRWFFKLLKICNSLPGARRTAAIAGCSR